jgi:Tol biopolymer transport system component
MERVSVASNGTQGNDTSWEPSIGADGRYVAFASDATNLVTPTTNGLMQIFVRDRQTGITTLVSCDNSGNQGNNTSVYPSISTDGRYVAFQSQSTNLVSVGIPMGTQMFVRDRQTNTTTLISVDPGGAQGNGDSEMPSISADGRYVAFESRASNLVTISTSDRQIFVRDLQANKTTLVSVDSSGNQGNDRSFHPSISSDGRYVAFDSFANNLVTGDVNGHRDVFIRDLQANTTTLVSVDSSGNQGNNDSDISSISADGRYVVFQSNASNLVTPSTSGSQIFVRDRQTNNTTLASLGPSGQGNNDSSYPSISADGRYVAFASNASNLITPSTSGSQIFVRDRQANTTTLVSENISGNQGNNDSDISSISANGYYVVFQSLSSNLVPGDTNSSTDVFVATLAQPTPANITSASVNTSLGAVNFTTSAGSISGLTNLPPSNMPCSSGGYIFPYGMFSYNITNLAPGATATVTITTPGAVPMGSKVFKCQNGNLTDFTQYVQQPDANTFILTLKDGGPGDADGVANGIIVDPCGPAFTDTSNHHRGSTLQPMAPQGPAPMANIAVQSASLSTAKVAPGAPVTVTANLANKGTANGSTQVKLYVNGQEEAHQGVTLSGGGNTPIKFTVSRDEPGSYSVYVGSLPAGTFEVDRLADPNLILYISGALLLFALAGGVIFMMMRRPR